MLFFRSKIRSVALVVLSVTGGILYGASLATAATTISSNIQTDGNLSVIGTSTFGGTVGIGTGGSDDTSNSFYVDEQLTTPTYEENAFIGFQYAPTSTTDGSDANNLFLAVYPGGSAHKVGNINLEYSYVDSTLFSPFTGTVDQINYQYSAAPVIGTGNVGTVVYDWGADLGGSNVTNKYYSWDDSRGVRRVKEDSTFNGVGQAIEALYNPQFTKYTPGAANFERIVLGQWDSNVAEIGTEAGGTGTLRQLRLLGTAVNLVPVAVSSLPSCTEGSIKPVTDSNTNTWGATITGGGSNHVLAYCDGTNWTVMAQ